MFRPIKRWQRSILIVLGGVAILACAGFFLSRWPGILPPAGPGPRDGFSQAEFDRIQPGDLILRRGVGSVSDLIVTFLRDGSGISHCAMVLDRPNDSQADCLMVQSLNASLGGADGVQTQSMKDFNRNTKPDSLVVLRPRLDSAMRQKLVITARLLLGRKIPFDNDFNLADRRALYCGELLAEIFEQADWWPKPQNGTSPRYRLVHGWLDFNSFLNPDYFELIVSHNPAVRRL